MKNIILISAVLFLFSCKSVLVDRTIKFDINYTSDYCGGAAPDQELLNSLKVPKPFNGKAYLNSNFERTGTTIELNFIDGKASVSGLTAGNYFLFKYPPIDFKKLEQESITSPDNIQVEIEKSGLILDEIIIEQKTKEVSKTIHIICEPMLQYRP